MSLEKPAPTLDAELALALCVGDRASVVVAAALTLLHASPTLQPVASVRENAQTLPPGEASHASATLRAIPLLRLFTI